MNQVTNSLCNKDFREKTKHSNPNINKIHDFLLECGVFFLLTADENKPCGRPFGAVMKHEGKLYISTADFKAVYAQLKSNANIQILALKNGTRSWLRLTGQAEETEDLAIKEQMLTACPVLKNHFATADSNHYKVFGIRCQKAELHTEQGVDEL